MVSVAKVGKKMFGGCWVPLREGRYGMERRNGG